MLYVGFHFNNFIALELLSCKFCCSYTFFFDFFSSFPLPQKLIIYSTIWLTLTTDFDLFPKFHALEYFFGFSNCFLARIKYPFRGSRTNCQGLLKEGFLRIIFLFFIDDLMLSGINLFLDQSPPPITFPALTLETPDIFFFFKKTFSISSYH